MAQHIVAGIIDATDAFTWVSGGTDPGSTIDEHSPNEATTGQVYIYNGNSQQTVLVEDDDASFYTHDSTQKTVEDVTIDGVSYPAGTLINLSRQVSFIDRATDETYTLHYGSMETTSTGHTATDFYIWAGKKAPPEGTELEVLENDRFSTALSYSSVTCFTAGTMIETPDGPVAVKTLNIGDVVTTPDGPCSIQWIGSRQLNADALAENPNLCPVCIKKGALSAQTPSADLLVSPQHRLRLSSRIINRMFHSEAVLIAAKKLVELPGIEIVETCQEVEYYHLALDCHSMVLSNGAWSETFYPGKEALKSLTPDARAEIFAIFPKLRIQGPETIPPAAPIIEKGGQIGNMIERHIKNAVMLC